MKKIIHLSIDDVKISLEDYVKLESYSPLIDFLQKEHQLYGLKITFYIQNWKFFYGLKNNAFLKLCSKSDWLKFGIHTPKRSNDFGTSTFQEGIEEWNDFASEIKRLGLNEKSIDTFFRLHTFAGSKEAIMGMKRAGGIDLQGFLTADDDRRSYYLTDEFNRIIYEQGDIIYDDGSDLFFKSTDMRLDWFDRKFQSAYFYRKPVKKSPYDELVFRDSRGELEKHPVLSIFTHEWKIYQKGHLTRKKHWLEDVCKFANEYGYEFGFLKDVINKDRAVSIKRNEN